MFYTVWIHVNLSIKMYDQREIIIIQTDYINFLKINIFSGSRCTYLPKTDNEL